MIDPQRTRPSPVRRVERTGHKVDPPPSRMRYVNGVWRPNAPGWPDVPLIPGRPS
jgi:hypothetical protein